MRRLVHRQPPPGICFQLLGSKVKLATAEGCERLDRTYTDVVDPHVGSKRSISAFCQSEGEENSRRAIFKYADAWQGILWLRPFGGCRRVSLER